MNLGQATEVLNDALAAAEHALQNLNRGVSATVRFDLIFPGDVRVLSYAKRGELWRLLVMLSPDDEEGRPLLEMSRQTRVQAAQLLAPLLIIIEEATETHMREVEEATELTFAFVKTVQSKQPTPPRIK